MDFIRLLKARDLAVGAGAMNTERWRPLAQNWIISTLASVVAGHAAAGAGLALLALIQETPSSLHSLADWLVLPIFAVGALLIGAFGGMFLGLFLLPVSLPVAAAGMIIMTLAERRSAIFRGRSWWCLAGLAVAATGVPYGVAFYGLPESDAQKNVLSREFVMVLLVAALIGALTGRRCWHACMNTGPAWDESKIEATSSTP